LNDSYISFGGVGDLSSMSLSFETSDQADGSLTAIYFTEPLEHGTVTSGLRFQAPLPWLALRPYQTAFVYTYDCRLRVLATRPTSAHRWELRVTGTPPTSPRAHGLLPTALDLETDVDRPPFRSLKISLTLSREGRTAQLRLAGPTP
jgi:hypothetical protein